MATKKVTTKEAVVKSSILKKARITEKAARGQAQNMYIFDVAPTATKSEIVKAFVAQFKHQPLKVNTVTVKSKAVVRRGVAGRIGKIKKAYVTLPKGKTIEVM